MNNNKDVIQVALYGMDTRASKMMTMYLHGPCKGAAVIVGEQDAKVDIIDADFLNLEEMLKERKENAAHRPLIILSLQPIVIDGAIYVAKPIKTEDMLAAFKQVSSQLSKNKGTPLVAKKEMAQGEPRSEFNVQSSESRLSREAYHSAASQEQGSNFSAVELVTKRTDTLVVESADSEKNKHSKHRTAVDLTEEVLSSYIGTIEGIDFTDEEQLLQASFDTKNYFLGYLESAVRVAREKQRIIQVNSHWKTLVIFPENNEIWLDAEDVQFRAFSGILMKNWAKKITLNAADPDKIGCSQQMNKFHDTEALLWKVAIWTSKGRYPSHIDINKPVYLTQWPNFTRLLITPNALQIAAVLIEAPKKLLDVAHQLEIKPEYVFIFISAAHELGFISQSEQQDRKPPTAAKESKSKGLLARIFGKLRK